LLHGEERRGGRWPSDAVQRQVILPPTQHTPGTGIEALDRERGSVHGARRSERRHGYRGEVERSSQNLQRDATQGRSIEACRVQGTDRFVVALVQRGHQKLRRVHRLGPTSSKNCGCTLGLAQDEGRTDTRREPGSPRGRRSDCLQRSTDGAVRFGQRLEKVDRPTFCAAVRTRSAGQVERSDDNTVTRIALGAGGSIGRTW